MKLEYYSRAKLVSQIKQIFAKYLSLTDYHLFFFGSRVRGDNFLRSDIDLGIEGKQPLSAVTRLALEEELENLPILYKLELIDFKSVSSKFKKEALKFSEIIN